MSKNLKTATSGSDNSNKLELGLDIKNDPSYWNFRVLKYEIDGQQVCGIHEVQYNVDGDIVGYGEYPTEIYGEDIQQLKEGVDKLREAFSKDVIELPIEE